MTDIETVKTAATIKQKDRVGLAYVSKILGFGDEFANKFAEIAKNYRGKSEFSGEEVEILCKLRRKQSAIPIDTDTLPFWQEVKRIIPEYTEHDVSFLSSSGMNVVLDFLSMLGAQQVYPGESPVINTLSINAYTRS